MIRSLVAMNALGVLLIIAASRLHLAREHRKNVVRCKQGRLVSGALRQAAVFSGERDTASAGVAHVERE
jgi:ABC-type ATPase involved in cell division